MSTAEKIIDIQLRRGTASKWMSTNPVLKSGKIGIEKDTGKFKIGDGITAWKNLKYANSPIVEIERAPTTTDISYEVGQLWKNTTGTKELYILEDISVTGTIATWKPIASLQTLLTGLSTSDTTAVSTSDSLLTGIGKLQGQINATNSNVASAKVDIALVESIAKGASRAKVFSTVIELTSWLAISANTATLQVGDNFLIVQRDVPDYWWDGTQKQELETQKIDLTDYPKTAEVQNMIAVEVIKLNAEIAKKANLKSPVFTDIPEVPTAATGTNTNQVASTAFVRNAIENLDDGDIG